MITNESTQEWEPIGIKARARGRSPVALDQQLPSPLSDPVGDDISNELRANLRANRLMRQTYAGKAYGLAAGCLIAWIALLCVYGAIRVTMGVETWSDQVLIAITTGVTVSVLAAFLGVIRGLFPGKGKDGEIGEAKA